MRRAKRLATTLTVIDKKKGDLGLTAEMALQSVNPALFQNLFGNGGWGQVLCLQIPWREGIAASSCRGTFPTSVLSDWSGKRKNFSRESSARNGIFREIGLWRIAPLKRVTIGGHGC